MVLLLLLYSLVVVTTEREEFLFLELLFSLLIEISISIDDLQLLFFMLDKLMDGTAAITRGEYRRVVLMIIQSYFGLRGEVVVRYEGLR